ncbi:helix-turn-helix transcriptional regulator [Allokutzneria albata]|uniref:DNA binding domain-containing protein, excisionase family n=1 Tax=Allokutzneria albata TaxID=211114 RepID=A0A1H0CAY2_ALLAB|nr:helix-turn-helix domain-containing protein [Allokutzneria albata]SDN55045.1 DNA binding domain-containing protein, excisionase family [Allokutzneria albata]
MPELWGPQELADYLKVSIETIYKWRTKRYGPPGVRIGKHVRYQPAEVLEWLNSLPKQVA